MPEVAPAEGLETTAETAMEAAEAVSGPEEAVASSETEAEAVSDGEEAAACAYEEDEFTPHAPSGHAKLVTDQGLTADKYAVSKPWIESDRLSEEE